MTTTATRTAREYARSSKGKGNRSRSTEQQHEENLAAGREHGWTWGEPYTDTGSASTYRTKEREGFDRLTADLADRSFGEPGTVLVLWEISRLSREMGVGTKIVDLCEASGYRIHVTNDERTYNPANHNDRHALNAGINDAELEARRLSKRTLRGVNSNLEAVNDDGDPAARPHGVLPYGYQRRYDLVDGKSRPVAQFEQPEEAEVIRELYRRVLAGESIRAVALDFQARGLTGRRGKPFSSQTLRVMLMKDAYRGYRSHKDSRTGKTSTVRASWPAIVDDATWHGVQALLKDPSRLTHTGTAIKHEFSTTVRCDVCGGPMTVAYGKRRPPAYTCHDKGCTRIDKAELDDYLTRHLLGWLARPDVSAALAPGGDDTELRTVRGQLASKRADLKEVQETEAESLAEERRLSRREERLESEVADLEQRERTLTRPNPLSRLIETGPGVAARWEAAPVTARRAIAALLLAPDVLGQARIKRVADSASEAVRDRVRWVQA